MSSTAKEKLNRAVARAQPYLVATLFVFGAHVLKLAIPHQIIHEIPFLLFFSAVVLAGIYGGLFAGLYATFLSALLADYFFIPPTHTFFKGNWHQDFKVFLYVVDCVTIAALCGSLKKAVEKARHTKDLESASRRRLESIFHISPASMALWSGPELKFALVNPRYQALFPGRELLGKPFLEALPEFREQGFAELLREVLETGIPYIGHEVLARHASTLGGPVEDHYYDFTYARLEDDHGGTLGVYDHAVDVTTRVMAIRAAERDAAELKASVIELSQEKELREKFVAALTHDLRTPITTVKLTAQLISRTAESADQAAKAKRIILAMDRADAMIRDLLDMSRIKAGVPLILRANSVDLCEIARATLAELTVIHGERFVLMGATQLHGIWDGSAVRRILENLATNAVKYGGPTSPVVITVQGNELEAELSVHNQENPIPALAQAELFGLFRRSLSANAGKQEGWGIGLSLVHGLAKAHGGKVGVRSSPEDGTTFRVKLKPLPSQA